jgi:hypothetical protein
MRGARPAICCTSEENSPPFSLWTKDASVIGPAMSSLLAFSILPFQHAPASDVSHASLVSCRVLASVRGQHKGRQHDAIRGNGEPNLFMTWFVG